MPSGHPNDLGTIDVLREPFTVSSRNQGVVQSEPDHGGDRQFFQVESPGLNEGEVVVDPSVDPQGIGYQTFGVGWDDSCSGYDVAFFDTMTAALEATNNRIYQEALLKAREGDEVQLMTPGGLERLEVIKVRYPAPQTSH